LIFFRHEIVIANIFAKIAMLHIPVSQSTFRRKQFTAILSQRFSSLLRAITVTRPHRLHHAFSSFCLLFSDILPVYAAAAFSAGSERQPVHMVMQKWR